MANVSENKWGPWPCDYDKTFYDVMLHDGTIIKHCWPNAGKMIDTSKDSRRQHVPDFEIKAVRVSPDHPLDKKEG